MHVLQLPKDILLKICLQMDASTLHTLRQVSSDINKWIINYIWNCKYSRNILQKRVNSNWIHNKHTEWNFWLTTNDWSPYVLKATEKYIILEDINDLNKEYQQVLIYEIEKNRYWQTEKFGPHKTIPIQQYNTFIRSEFLINDHILAITFEPKNTEKYKYNRIMKVWSLKTKLLIDEKLIENFTAIHFHEEKSTFILLTTNKIEILKFFEDSILESNHFQMEFELHQSRSDTSNYYFPYLIYWQNNETIVGEYQVYVWNINTEKMSSDILLHYNEFKSSVGLIISKRNEENDYMITEIICDAIFITNNFIVLVQEKIIYDMTWEHYEYNSKHMKLRKIASFSKM